MEYLKDLGTINLLLVIFSAFLVGASKAGIKGLGLLLVPIMASVYGAKDSTGIVLPMLILADILAVFYYPKSVNWGYIKKLLVWAIVGILIGVFVGDIVNESLFKWLLAGIIILMLCLLLINDLKKSEKIPDNKFFAIVMGLMGGFATMVGNAAGPVFSIYLLAMRLPKREFIGTGAVFFLIINLFKVPFHIFAWKTIDAQTLILDLIMFPVIIVGILIGIWLIKLFPEKLYRYFVIVMTSIAAFIMLLS